MGAANVALTCLLFLSLAEIAAEPDLKVVCAATAAKGPKVDGALDDECWKLAEAHDDFLLLAGSRPGRTAMRLVHDDKALYLGLEFEWADPTKLRQGIAAIQAKFPNELGFVSIERFENLYGAELFLDPGVSLRNHYQILLNAGGQICGHYKYDWNAFDVKPWFQSSVAPKGWTAEVVLPLEAFPGASLRPGDEWGFNLVRNDDRPAAIWCDVGGVFNEPKRFGKLIIGSYQTWWQAAVGQRLVSAFEGMAADKALLERNPNLRAMVADLAPHIESLQRTKANVGLESREAFLRVYQEYGKVFRRFSRLEAYHAVCVEMSVTGQGKPKEILP